MTITQTTDHKAEALALLLEQFKNKATLAALLNANMIQVQELEDVFFDIMAKLVLSVAVGDQLDIFGKIVVEPRLGRTDGVYAAFIAARILINRSNGRVEEINAVLAIVLPVTTGGTFRVHDRADGSFYLEETTAGGSVFDTPTITALLRELKGGGIGSQLTFLPSAQSAPPFGIFHFADADVAQADSVNGFSSTAQAAGGKLADAVQ